MTNVYCAFTVLIHKLNCMSDKIKFNNKPISPGIVYAGEGKDRLELRRLAKIPGNKLFGGRKINWMVIGDDWKDRIYNFIRSYDIEYENVVRDEFFQDLKERVMNAELLLNDIEEINPEDISEDKKNTLIGLAKQKHRELAGPELKMQMEKMLNTTLLNEEEQKGIMNNPRILKISTIDEFKAILSKEYPHAENRERYQDEERKLQGQNPGFLALRAESFRHEVPDTEDQITRIAVFMTVRNNTIPDKAELNQFLEKYPQYNLITTKEDFNAFKKDWEDYQ